MKHLIVVDMQNDFISGPLGSKEAEAIVPKVAKKIEEYHKDPKGSVVFTQDTHMNNYMDTLEGKLLPVPHCLVNTDGWKIDSRLNVEDDDIVVDKRTFGSVHLASAIRRCARAAYEAGRLDKEDKASIEIVGVCTDICVVSNALMLRAEFPDIRIYVDPECCAGTSVENHEAALKVMKSCQIEIRKHGNSKKK